LSSPGEFLTRWRVRLGYPAALAACWFAHPTPQSIAACAAVGLIGLLVRALAAGYLHKNEQLATSGPYAFTRNPLYLGSSILAAGFLIGFHSWWAAAIVAAYFAVFYPAVIRREERILRARHGTTFDEYARRVPLFFPRLTPRRDVEGSSVRFSWAQYIRNREYRAAIGFAIGLALLTVLMKWRG
jgi:protein-S-isoprenylcysteine O-methyltransferase Ste14